MHSPKIEVVDIILPLEDSESADAQRAAIAAQLDASPDRVKDWRLRKHSIDARQRQIKVQLRFEVGLDADLPPEPELS